VTAPPAIDAADVARSTGWRVIVHERVGSTNDEAAALRDAGAGPRVAVVATEQAAGRGRGGRRFASPRGGLYVSLLVEAPPDDDGAAARWTSALASLAVAEAIEIAAGVPTRVKWPNDVWVRGKKVAGLLLEGAGPRAPVVVGIGVNVRDVPLDLAPDVTAAVTSLERESGRAPDAGRLLAEILARTDMVMREAATGAGRSRAERRWRDRLLFVGERVSWTAAGRRETGRLVAATFDALEVETDAGPSRLHAAHVHDLRPVGAGSGSAAC
jgi:BirA family biotin operon repressor/biotin-[acetyl-CoA-carboxylase] ligase